VARAHRFPDRPGARHASTATIVEWANLAENQRPLPSEGHQLGHYEDGMRLTVEVVWLGCSVPPSTAA
jgi:hypothetical protein